MITRLERGEFPDLALLSAFGGLQARMWTALPGIIDSFSPERMTASVQPAVQAQVTGSDGQRVWVDLPLLIECPVVFPSGGGFTLTFPLAQGDECLVVFASRCVDGWWQEGGSRKQIELRMHDLSDGFVLPGPRSQPRVLAGVSVEEVQLRSDDGAAFLSIAPTHAIRLVTPGNLQAQVGGDAVVEVTGSATITASSVQINGPVQIVGDVTVTGNISSSASIAAPSLSASASLQVAGLEMGTHTHGGVQTGTGTTGGPA